MGRRASYVENQCYKEGFILMDHMITDWSVLSHLDPIYRFRNVLYTISDAENYFTSISDTFWAETRNRCLLRWNWAKKWSKPSVEWLQIITNNSGDYSKKLECFVIEDNYCVYLKLSIFVGPISINVSEQTRHFLKTLPNFYLCSSWKHPFSVIEETITWDTAAQKFVLSSSNKLFNNFNFW